MEEMYKVYVRIDELGRVLDVNSSVFLNDTTGWIEIDEGVGQRYGHAQVYYLPGALVDDRGLYRYKYENRRIVERTQAEINADYVEPEQPAPSDSDARIAALEKQVAEQAKLLASYEAAYAEGVQSA